MGKRILIVEDDPLVAAFLVLLMENALDCAVINVPSVQRARLLVDAGVDFALLDVEVEDGATYDLAIDMAHNDIPVAFFSGSDPSKVPREIAHAPFLRKPAQDTEILALARRYL